MNYYFKELIDKLNRDNRINKYDGRSYEGRRKVYMNGKEYEEKKLTIIYSLDIGDIFRHTVAISVIYIIEINLCKVVNHYIENPKSFNSLDYSEISKIIIDTINKEIRENSEKIAI